MKRLLAIFFVISFFFTQELFPMQFIKRFYWQDKIAQLPQSKQQNGWLLEDLKKTLLQTPDQPLDFQACTCWDLLLQYHRIKQADSIKKLQSLITNYNSVNSQAKATQKADLYNFIRQHTFTSPSTKKALKFLQKKAKKNKLLRTNPYAVLAALITGGTSGGILFTIAANNSKKILSFIGNSSPITYLAQTTEIPKENCIALPPSLAAIDDCNIIHMPSIQQPNYYECGYYAAFNAIAIEALFKSGKEINAQTVAQYIKDHALEKEIKNNGQWLHIKEIDALAKKYGTSVHGIYPKIEENYGNCFTINLDTPSSISTGYHFAYNKKTDNCKKTGNYAEKRNALHNLIGDKNNFIIHFTCHTMKEKHWSHVSIYKRLTDAKPTMILLDSLRNNSMDEDCCQFKSIFLLYKWIIAEEKLNTTENEHSL
jgi:hypothetical protein